MEYTHIKDCWNEIGKFFENYKPHDKKIAVDEDYCSEVMDNIRDEFNDLTQNFPRWSGDWDLLIEPIPEEQTTLGLRVTNSFYDRDAEETIYEEEFYNIEAAESAAIESVTELRGVDITKPTFNVMLSDGSEVEVTIEGTELVVEGTNPSEDDTFFNAVRDVLIREKLICMGEDGDHYYLVNSIFMIAQLPISHDHKFRPDKVTPLEDFVGVWADEVKSLTERYATDLEICEMVFTKFNTDHPKNFAGHSLSVSDIVYIKTGSNVRVYRCEPVGFKDLTDTYSEESSDGERNEDSLSN